MAYTQITSNNYSFHGVYLNQHSHHWKAKKKITYWDDENAIPGLGPCTSMKTCCQLEPNSFGIG